jgi:hypothetical protein
MANPRKAAKPQKGTLNTSGPWTGTRSITARNKKFLVAPTAVFRVQLLDLPTKDGKLYRVFKDKSIQWSSPKDFTNKGAAFRYADEIDKSGVSLPGIGYHKNTYIVYRRFAP